MNGGIAVETIGLSAGARGDGEEQPEDDPGPAHDEGGRSAALINAADNARATRRGEAGWVDRAQTLGHNPR